MFAVRLFQIRVDLVIVDFLSIFTSQHPLHRPNIFNWGVTHIRNNSDQCSFVVLIPAYS